MTDKSKDKILIDCEGSWDAKPSPHACKVMDEIYKTIKDISKTLPKVGLNNTEIAKALGASFHMPVVRRTFPSLLANEIVSVQPMTMPSGLMFYTDFKFGRRGIGNRYMNTKLRPTKMYKVMIINGQTEPLRDNKLHVINQVQMYDICMYIKGIDHIMGKDYHKIMVGDQAGYIRADRVRFKRVTPRMIQRAQELSDKTNDQAEQEATEHSTT